MPHPVRSKLLASASLAACLALAALFSLPEPAGALLGLFSDTKTLSPTGDTVTIPLAEVSDGKAHFYALTAGGKEVRFFAVKTADGKVRTAFVACDVCYPRRRATARRGIHGLRQTAAAASLSARSAEVTAAAIPRPGLGRRRGRPAPVHGRPDRRRDVLLTARPLPQRGPSP